MHNISLQGKDLPKTDKKPTVLKGVIFTVVQGSIFALLSFKGVGKTTIIKIFKSRSSRKGGVL